MQDTVQRLLSNVWKILYKIFSQIREPIHEKAIDYCIDELLDEDQQEEILDYFMESDSDKIQLALDEFDGDYDDDELRLMRIKFISDVAN